MTAVSPLILHVRCVTGAGGGPEKTILNSPRFLARLGYDCICAYMHPPNDPGFDVLRRRAGAADTVNPVLVIERLAASGRLGVTPGCARCGRDDAATAHVTLLPAVHSPMLTSRLNEAVAPAARLPEKTCTPPTETV